MTPSDIERFRAAMQLRVEPPPGASPQMQAIIAALSSKPKILKEREAMKAMEEPLERLKSAPDQERVAFVFEAVAQMASPADIALVIALKAATAELLRKGVPLNSLEAVHLIEAVSVRQFRFIFRIRQCLGPSKVFR